MKTRLLFLLVGLFQMSWFGVFAQTDAQESVWELVSADINLLYNGTSVLIHTLTAAEIEEKAIPVTLEFGKSTLSIMSRKTKTQLKYVPETGRSAQTISDTENQQTYLFWIEGNNTLIAVSDYDNSDYKGNELRLIYKKK